MNKVTKWILGLAVLVLLVGVGFTLNSSGENSTSGVAMGVTASETVDENIKKINEEKAEQEKKAAEEKAEAEKKAEQEKLAKEEEAKKEQEVKDKQAAEEKAKQEKKAESTEKKAEPKKETAKKSEPAKKAVVKTEKISGDFMSTIQLNIRSGPGLNNKSVGTLQPYEKAVAVEKANGGGITWYKIKYGNVEGWASAGYLETFKEGAKPKPAAKKQTAPASKAAASSGYKANHIYFGGKAVPYRNIGKADGADGTKGNAQHVIDTTSNAATWGGAATFSGTDGMNTHFIGHNPGQFSGMHNSSTFIVTDANGRAFTYQKTTLYVVDEYGKRTSDGADMWSRITGTGGGERITLQSTKSHPLKYIVEAVLVK